MVRQFQHWMRTRFHSRAAEGAATGSGACRRRGPRRPPAAESQTGQPPSLRSTAAAESREASDGEVAPGGRRPRRARRRGRRRPACPPSTPSAMASSSSGPRIRRAGAAPGAPDAGQGRRLQRLDDGGERRRARPATGRGRWRAGERRRGGRRAGAGRPGAGPARPPARVGHVGEGVEELAWGSRGDSSAKRRARRAKSSAGRGSLRYTTSPGSAGRARTAHRVLAPGHLAVPGRVVEAGPGPRHRPAHHGADGALGPVGRVHVDADAHEHDEGGDGVKQARPPGAATPGRTGRTRAATW